MPADQKRVNLFGASYVPDKHYHTGFPYVSVTEASSAITSRSSKSYQCRYASATANRCPVLMFRQITSSTSLAIRSADEAEEVGMATMTRCGFIVRILVTAASMVYPDARPSSVRITHFFVRSGNGLPVANLAIRSRIFRRVAAIAVSTSFCDSPSVLRSC